MNISVSIMKIYGLRPHRTVWLCGEATLWVIKTGREKSRPVKHFSDGHGSQEKFKSLPKPRGLRESPYRKAMKGVGHLPQQPNLPTISILNELAFHLT